MSSISTEKLSIIMQTIESKIFADPDLKARVTKIEIKWKTEPGAWGAEFVVVPDLNIEFKP